MTALERIFETWSGIIAALVACALIVAPVAAQAKMSQHEASHSISFKDKSGHGDARGHDVSGHQHAGHHDQADEPVPIKSSHQHDHSKQHDNSCCGTYCHSGCIASSVEIPSPTALATAYAVFTPVHRLAVAPDQPQRPPSNLLSF